MPEVLRPGRSRGRNGRCYPAVTSVEAGFAPPPMRLLIVEDHEELAMTLATGPRRGGMAGGVALGGGAGAQRAALDGYDVIVLDRDLPGLHGDLVCRRLVAAGCRARRLVVSPGGGTRGGRGAPPPPAP